MLFPCTHYNSLKHRLCSARLTRSGFNPWLPPVRTNMNVQRAAHVSLQATRPQPRADHTAKRSPSMTHIDTRQRQSHTTSPPASARQTVVDLRAIPKRDAPCTMADGEEKPPSARDGQGATARSHPGEADFASLLECGRRLERKASRRYVKYNLLLFFYTRFALEVYYS